MHYALCIELNISFMQINLSEKVLHFEKPARTSRGEYTEHRMILITMTDEKNRFGMGECAPLPDLSCDAHAYDSIGAVAKLINEAMASDDYAEYLRPYPALLFALESAMYDFSKSPVLYDTPFAHSEEGIPFNGLIWMDDYDGMLRQVKKKLLQGFRCIKFKIGAIAWDEELRLLKTVRSRYSKDSLQIRVDANGGLVKPFDGSEKAMDEVLAKLDELNALGVHSIEQPIMAGQWDKMADLCQRTPLPIALDEELIGVNQLADKQRLLDTIRPQFIVLKPMLHGGMAGTIEWANEANKRGIGSWITSALESNIGLRNVAFLAARIYGPNIRFPQGLGTGQLYTDNIAMDIEQRGAKMWRCEVDE